VGGRVGGVSGGGGGCESDLTSTPVEMCRWGGPVGLRLKGLCHQLESAKSFYIG
jgi:hypothetical protein